MKIGFLFSLPRAGSTYSQRVLSSSPDVITTPETWLFPALYGIRKGDAPIAEFAYDHVRAGLTDVVNLMDDGEAVWRDAIRHFAESFFSPFVDEGQLFLEKTPRNAAFSADLIESFPNAPVLFLWRNPLSVVASINRTWGGGKRKAYFYDYDLRVGLKAMIDSARKYASLPNVKCVRYEDLVSSPDAIWPEIFDHFGATYKADFVNKPRKMLSTMGDQTGQVKYSGTSSDSVLSWQKAFGSGPRRKWAHAYLEYIGEEDLAFMGYDKNELLAGLSHKGDRHWSDAFLISGTPLYHRLEPYALKTKSGRNGNTKFARR